MSVEKYIKDNVGCLGGKVYIAPEIPEKKLNAAIKSMAPELDPDYVLAIVDTTVFGGAKDGCVFTGDTIYVHPIGSKTYKMDLANILNAKYSCSEIEKNNGKIEKREELIIHYKDGEKRELSTFIFGMNIKKFEELINGIVSEAGEGAEFITTSQTSPLSMMDEKIKMDYIKIMCNFAYADDELIDSSEYAEIMSLIVRIDLDATSRLSIRNYILDANNHEETAVVIQRLEQEINGSNYELIKKSLMKDVVYLHRANNGNVNWKENAFIIMLQESLGISVEQIEYIIDAIKNDEEILEQRKNDTEIKKSMKELASKATAVGVPLAAIYLSGSVMGVSAAGLTSGLATLGMGGVLGFSSMFTGIGVAVLLGVGAYKGVKKVTGISDLENNKQRELMIQAIIKNLQKSMNYLVEDINEITNQLSNEIANGLRSEIKIKKLSALLSMLSNGAQATTNKIQNAKKESIITRLPEKLDKVRLFELTGDATKLKYRELVLECYDLTKVEKEEGKFQEVYVLNYQLEESELEQLHSTFEGIGYFNLKDATFASAKGVAKGFVLSLKGQGE